MLNRRTVSDYLRQGVVIEPHEAVAIAQELIANGMPLDELEPPFGPPTVDNVELASDGRVLCRHCGVTPAVSELGRLVDAMISHTGALRAPGGLRYALARSLNDVDAPPFDSLDAFSAALARYERGDRKIVLRDLAARAILAPPLNEPEAVLVSSGPQVVPLATERVAALRPNDLPLTLPQPGHVNLGPAEVRPFPYERRRPVVEPPPPSRFAWVAAAAMAASLSFSATYVIVSHSRIRQAATTVATSHAAPPPSVSEAPPVAPVATESQPTPEPAPPPRPTRTSGVVEARHDAGPMFSPSFASNGTALFYHTGRSSDARSALAESTLDGDLQVMTILDDGARNYHVQPSPDGTRIAFDSDRDGDRGVYIADVNGQNVHRVSGPGYAAVPSWSPDGRQLAFVRAETDRPRVWNLWLTTLANSETRRLTHFRFGQTWGASWFRSGDAIAYTHEDRLTVLNLASGKQRDFKSPVAGRLVRTAAVSPDGRHVIFQVSRSGAWLVDLDDGSMRCVLTDPSAEEFAWSPDGRRVAFHSRRDGQWGIWIMAPST